MGIDIVKGFSQGFGALFSMWQVWAFILFMLALRLGPELYESWRLGKAGMPQIDRMTGLEFEKYLEILFSRMGYNAERTRYVGDQGGDLVLVKGAERILVQAKRHSKAVGNKAVQEAAAARPHYKCNRAMVVSNQEFTKAAIELARSNQVELWGRKKLAEVVMSLQAQPGKVGESTPAATPIVQVAAAKAAPPTAPACQRCGRPMVMRNSARGKFWGCSGFPKCRNTAPLQ